MLGKRLSLLRNTATQDEVAVKIGISRARYSHYETGRSEPDATTLRKLSEYFNCTTDYLLGISDIPKPEIPQLAYTKLPILGTIRAGLPIIAEEHIEGYLDVPDYMRADYVLTVTGDSMIGVGILDGDLAICKESKEPQTGQIIVARKDISTEYSETTLKFYFNNDGKPVLRAANPDYPDIDYSGERYSTAGHLVAIVRRDAPGYQVYRDFLTVRDNEEWTEVVATAASYGLSPQEVISMLNVQWKMLERMRRK